MAKYARAGQPLTSREVQVVALMAQGLSNKLIAVKLNIADHTAKYHVTNVCKKLGSDTRTLAVVNWIVGRACPQCRELGVPVKELVRGG